MPGDDLESPELTSTPDTVRLLAVWLRALAGPEGREELSPQQIRDAIWPTKPRHRPRPTPSEVEDMMLELDRIGWLTIYPHPTDPSRTIFQILATWPADPSKERPTPDLPPPPQTPCSTKGAETPAVAQNPQNHADLTTFRKVAVGGEGERAGESERAEAAAPSREQQSVVNLEQEPHRTPSFEPPNPDPQQHPAATIGIRLSPSRFCSMHRGGPPEGVDCRDCGTARARAERHLELKTARRRAMGLPPIEREFMIRGIDEELRALEEAAAAAGRPRSAPQTLPGMEHTTAPEPTEDPFDESPF